MTKEKRKKKWGTYEATKSDECLWVEIQKCEVFIVVQNELCEKLEALNVLVFGLFTPICAYNNVNTTEIDGKTHMSAEASPAAKSEL